MSTVSIPNQIQTGQPLDPRPVMANFDALASFANDDVLTLDGSKAMTGHLTLSGPGTAGGHAVTKAQLDDAGGDAAADATAKADKALVDANADATAKADKALADAKIYSDEQKVKVAYAADLSAVQVVTSETAQEVLGVTASAPRAGHFVVTATIDVRVNTLGAVDSGGAGFAEIFIGELKVKGAVQSQQMIWYPGRSYAETGGGAGERCTISQTWIVPVAAGSTALQVSARHNKVNQGGSFLCTTEQHTYIQALFVG